jgi:membrane protein
MLQDYLETGLEWLKAVIREPHQTQTRWGRTIRFGYDLIIVGAKQLREDRAPQMAAALAFRTLFGLIPVVVVATVLVRALSGPMEFKKTLEGWIDSLVTRLNLGEVSVFAVTEGGDPQTLAEWLKQVISPVADINLAAIGWIGVAVLIYAAIGLMVTIENSFNTVYRAPEGRSWARRFQVYWFVLTVAPVAIGLTFWLDARIEQWIEYIGRFTWLLTALRVAWGVALSWLVMFLIYWQVPNTNVAIRPALIGAGVAAIIIEIGKRSLDAYVGNMLSLQQLYGSLGLIPLFMFWVYLMWLTALLGLEVASTLQHLHGRKLEELEPKRPVTGVVDPVMIVRVMQIVAERFSQSLATTSRQLSEQACIAEPTVCLMLDKLVQENVLHRLDREDNAVTLARPPQQITADQLMEIGYALADDGQEGAASMVVRSLREAQKKLASTLTLSTLADSAPPPQQPCA